jgi:methionyl-tRNA formyltransferase
MNKIKLIYAGTAEIATPLLRSLKRDERFEISLVITQIDRPAGRKMEFTPSPVKKEAEKLEIPIFQPDNINDPESIKKIKAENPDVMIVMAYGQILNTDVLNIPKQGCLNIHASLLPKYRGASPIQSALLNQEKETGISIMKMVEKMDAGPVFAKLPAPIEKDDNAIILAEKLAHLAAHQSRDILYSALTEKLKPEEQDEKSATYCIKIKKEDGNINWDESSNIIAAKIRAFAGWPGTYTYFNGKRLKILEDKSDDSEHDQNPGTVFNLNDQIAIAAKKGAVVISQLQLEGKNSQNINDFINGNPDFINSKLTSTP